jgi:Zn-finger nucleic acid-binding protein
MESVKCQGITVDRCIDCKGIWFDLFEAEDLIETEDGASVDIGNKLKGMKMDRIHDINCPRCGKQMQTVSDREDPHLKFEVCQTCHGYFLDAGELRDMAHVTTAEKASESLFEKTKQFIFAFQAMHMRDLPRGE